MAAVVPCPPRRVVHPDQGPPVADAPERHARAWFVSRATRMTPRLRTRRRSTAGSRTSTESRHDPPRRVSAPSSARRRARLVARRGGRNGRFSPTIWLSDYHTGRQRDPTTTTPRAGSCRVCVRALPGQRSPQTRLPHPIQDVLLQHMAADCSCSAELAAPSRTLSLFTLEAMATSAAPLSPEDDLGLSTPLWPRMRRAGVHVPYLRDNNRGRSHPSDVHANCPMRQASLSSRRGAEAPNYIDLWSACRPIRSRRSSALFVRSRPVVRLSCPTLAVLGSQCSRGSRGSRAAARARARYRSRVPTATSRSDLGRRHGGLLYQIHPRGRVLSRRRPASSSTREPRHDWNAGTIAARHEQEYPTRASMPRALPQQHPPVTFRPEERHAVLRRIRAFDDGVGFRYGCRRARTPDDATMFLPEDRPPGPTSARPLRVAVCAPCGSSACRPAIGAPR